MRELGVTQVVLAGLATSYGVESTARQAYDLGYNVVVVSDAINNPQAESRQSTIANLLPAISKCASTQDLLAVVEAGWTTPLASAGERRCSNDGESQL